MSWIFDAKKAIHTNEHKRLKDASARETEEQGRPGAAGTRHRSCWACRARSGQEKTRRQRESPLKLLGVSRSLPAGEDTEILGGTSVGACRFALTGSSPTLAPSLHAGSWVKTWS